jgi:hypothetical protein
MSRNQRSDNTKLRRLRSSFCFLKMSKVQDQIFRKHLKLSQFKQRSLTLLRTTPSCSQPQPGSNNSPNASQKSAFNSHSNQFQSKKGIFPLRIRRRISFSFSSSPFLVTIVEGTIYTSFNGTKAQLITIFYSYTTSQKAEIMIVSQVNNSPL